MRPLVKSSLFQIPENITCRGCREALEDKIGEYALCPPPPLALCTPSSLEEICAKSWDDKPRWWFKFALPIGFAVALNAYCICLNPIILQKKLWFKLALKRSAHTFGLVFWGSGVDPPLGDNVTFLPFFLEEGRIKILFDFEFEIQVAQQKMPKATNWFGKTLNKDIIPIPKNIVCIFAISRFCRILFTAERSWTWSSRKQIGWGGGWGGGGGGGGAEGGGGRAGPDVIVQSKQKIEQNIDCWIIYILMNLCYSSRNCLSITKDCDDK